MEKTHDQPELVVQSWTQFEREEGSLESWEQCRKLCKTKMAKVEEIRRKEREAEEESERLKAEKRREKNRQHKKDVRQNAAGGHGFVPQQARHHEAKSDEGFKMPQPPAAVKRKVAPPPGFENHQGAKKVAPPPGFVPPSGDKRAVAPPPGYEAHTAGGDEEPVSKRPKVDGGEDGGGGGDTKQRTVFLSNLEFSVTEEDIERVMQGSGKILELRLVKTPAGRSKGFAFVEFQDSAGAANAMKRDRELLNGRPMYVSECNPEKKGHTFKYSTELEKKKLFVKGLPPSVTKEALEDMFSKYGKLADVRLVTYRNGHSKGLAFVDFEDEVAAAAALLKTDGMKIEDKEISVAISNPPKRKGPFIFRSFCNQACLSLTENIP